MGGTLAVAASVTHLALPGAGPWLLSSVAVVGAAWTGGLAAGLVTMLVAVAVGSAAGGVAGWLPTLGFLAEGTVLALLASRARGAAIAAHGATLAAAHRLDALVRGVDEGITVQDAAGRLLYANAIAARLVGFASPDELLGAEGSEIVQRFEMYGEDGNPFPPSELPGRVLLRGDPPTEAVLRFRSRADGIERWANVRASPIYDADGNVLYAINLFRDVTLKRRHAEAARIAQEWLSTTLRSIGDAVIATDRAGTITFMNPIAEALTGWRQADATGRELREVFQILDEDDRTPCESPVERVIRENTIVGLANHTILVRRDGAELSIDDSAAPIRDQRGGLVGVVLVFRDVTQRRRSELRRAFLARATEELNGTVDYQQALATVARLAVPEVADWCAVDVLEGGEVRRLAVAHRDPAKIELVAEIQRRFPEDPETSPVQRILRTGASELFPEIPDELIEQTVTDPEQRVLVRQLALRSYMGVPLKRVGETPVGVITFAMAESNRRYDRDDLTLAEILADRGAVAVERARLFSEQVTARRMLEGARADAERANRSKDEFLAMLGHELRNPLAPILTALEVIRLRGVTGVEEERAVIERQVRHMVRLVDDLLDISRITRGVVRIDKEPVEIGEVVSKALELAGPLLEQRQHRIQVAVEPDLMVLGDPVRLAQVLANLLSNAGKFTPAGGRVEIVGSLAKGEVVLRVSDDGIGMDPELVPQVFELFVQGHQALDRSGGGLGLGLAIVQRLVELHGGTVAAESPGPGKGSTFTVRLPALQGVPRRDPPPLAEVEGRGARLLVVDDNIDARETLAAALELAGHEVHQAEDAPSALAVAATLRPEVALVDIGLPVMDGYELARRLRAMPELAGTRLVALTGYGLASDRAKAMEAGFDEHLVKPASLELLHDTITRLIR